MGDPRIVSLGPNELILKQLTYMSEWEVPQVQALDEAFRTVMSVSGKIAKALGLENEGQSAEKAVASASESEKGAKDTVENVPTLTDAVEQANHDRDAARNVQLPPGELTPDYAAWARMQAPGTTFQVPGYGVYVSRPGVDPVPGINDMLQKHREAEAQKEVHKLETAFTKASEGIKKPEPIKLGTLQGKVDPDDFGLGTPSTKPGGGGGGGGGGGTGGGGGGGGSYSLPGGGGGGYTLPGGGGGGYTLPGGGGGGYTTPIADLPGHPGHNHGSPGGGGGTGGGGNGSSSVDSGMNGAGRAAGMGALGAGTAGLGLGVASKLGQSLGRGGAGGLGLTDTSRIPSYALNPVATGPDGARLTYDPTRGAVGGSEAGAGKTAGRGLLAAQSGAAGAGASGSGSGSGGRGGGFMGGGGMGGGGGDGKEKSRRQGLGLLAPKLDDDDAPTIRSIRTMPGSRRNS